MYEAVECHEYLELPALTIGVDGDGAGRTVILELEEMGIPVERIHWGLPCHSDTCLLYTISEPTRLLSISYAVFCLKKKIYQKFPLIIMLDSLSLIHISEPQRLMSSA